MQPNELIRIENNEGHGPYRSFWKGKDDIDNGNPKHPLPHKDGKLTLENPDFFCSYFGFFLAFNYLFGFSNVEQMQHWFYEHDWIRGLHEAGYKAVVYRGDVRHGYTQAIINTESKEKIRECSLLELYGLTN